MDYPAPTVDGTFKAFASVMFAFAGASTFPTIQADMKHKHEVKKDFVKTSFTTPLGRV